MSRALARRVIRLEARRLDTGPYVTRLLCDPAFMKSELGKDRSQPKRAALGPVFWAALEQWNSLNPPLPEAK